MNEIVKGQPLTLPDGTILLPEPDKETGSKLVSKDELQEREAHAELTKQLNELLDDPINNEYSELYRRTLADVNVDFPLMNVTMLVMTYTLWGLDSYAISRVLNVPEHQVEAVKQSDLYSQVQKEVVEAIKYAEAATVHGYLSSKSHLAARVVASTLTSKDGDLRLAAAKDLLDRTGFRPADRVEHVMRFEDELRIRYVQDTSNIPTIDLKVETE